MSSEEREGNAIYEVVVNQEEQYSIWLGAGASSRGEHHAIGRPARV